MSQPPSPTSPASPSRTGGSTLTNNNAMTDKIKRYAAYLRGDTFVESCRRAVESAQTYWFGAGVNPTSEQIKERGEQAAERCARYLESLEPEKIPYAIGQGTEGQVGDACLKLVAKGIVPDVLTGEAFLVARKARADAPLMPAPQPGIPGYKKILFSSGQVRALESVPVFDTELADFRIDPFNGKITHYVNPAAHLTTDKPAQLVGVYAFAHFKGDSQSVIRYFPVDAALRAEYKRQPRQSPEQVYYLHRALRAAMKHAISTVIQDASISELMGATEDEDVAQVQNQGQGEGEAPAESAARRTRAPKLPSPVSEQPAPAAPAPTPEPQPAPVVSVPVPPPALEPTTTPAAAPAPATKTPEPAPTPVSVGPAEPEMRSFASIAAKGLMTQPARVMGDEKIPSFHFNADNGATVVATRAGFTPAPARKAMFDFAVCLADGSNHVIPKDFVRDAYTQLASAQRPAVPPPTAPSPASAGQKV